MDKSWDDLDPEKQMDCNATLCGFPECEDRYWYVFLSSSLILFFGGLAAVLLLRLILYLACKSKVQDTPQGNNSAPRSRSQQRGAFGKDLDPEVPWLIGVRDWASGLISAQSKSGKFLVSVFFLASMSSFALYIYDCGRPVEWCFSVHTDTVFQIDLAFNIFFMFYFLLRFIAASDLFFFWISLNSIVDFFTIPPIFVSIYLERTWLGLRFLRALRLIQLSEILQFLSVLKTSNSIKLVNLLTVFLSMWLTAAGFIHLVENTGDPWLDFSNVQKLSFWNSLYMVIVTISTVGFGDITPETVFGKIFTIGAIVCGVVSIFKSITSVECNHKTLMDLQGLQ